MILLRGSGGYVWGLQTLGDFLSFYYETMFLPVCFPAHQPSSKITYSEKKGFAPNENPSKHSL